MLSYLVYIVVEAEPEVNRSGDDLKCHIKHLLTCFIFFVPSAPAGVTRGRSEAEAGLDHPDRQVEVALLGGMDDGVAPGLGEAGAAVVVPGAAVNGCAAVGGTDDLDGLGDVLHCACLLYVYMSGGAAVCNIIIPIFSDP